MSRLFTGAVLLGLAIGVLMWRIRYDRQASSRREEVKCPVCGNTLQRCRRRHRDYLINLLVPVRRYRCNSPECRWAGLRIKRPSHSQKEIANARESG